MSTAVRMLTWIMLGAALVMAVLITAACWREIITDWMRQDDEEPWLPIDRRRWR